MILPTLVAIVAGDSKAKPGSVQHLKAEEKVQDPSSSIAITGPPSSKSGTKDAPVDGLDGKPHAGPFVETTKKKSSQQVEDLGAIMIGKSKDSSKVLKETFDRPEDDGVMSDITNHKQVTGPTGTEGGVSQKEGQVEKKPEQPKEARPRPEDEEETKSSSKTKADGDDERERKKGAAGLEVPNETRNKFEILSDTKT